MPRSRSRSKTATRVAIKKSGTILANVGHASVPGTFEILETEGGLRTTTGNTQTIQDSASTAEVCRVGDIVKYVTLYLQAAGRVAVSTPDNIPGWIEWAFVCVKESETTVPITQTGVQTLADICMKMFRNECIYTGAMPIGREVANYQEIHIKIPRAKQQIKLGDEWRFITLFRSNNSTDAATDRIRLVKSFSYKCYS